MKTTIPNLFRDYATSELSQDAFICWLLAYAGYKSDDPEREKLRRCGREFAFELLNRDKDRKPVELPEEFGIEIHKQDKNIDVLALIDNKHVLLIEDKTTTGTHGDQLERYYDHVEGGRTKLGAVKPEDIYRIYFKTGNQSRAEDNRIEKETGYRVFLREDFLCVLDSYEGENAILSDYRCYLQDLENRANSYKEWRKDSDKSWSALGSWEAWEGFFRRLEGDIPDDIHNSKWGELNPGGGNRFLCFSWEAPGEAPGWLQIESHKQELRFKVYEGEKEKRTDTRNKYYNLFMKAGNRNEERVIKPQRFGVGEHMAAAVWKEDWMAFGENGFLDMEGTVANLQEAEKVLRSAQALAKAQAP